MVGQSSRSRSLSRRLFQIHRWRLQPRPIDQIHVPPQQQQSCRRRAPNGVFNFSGTSSTTRQITFHHNTGGLNNSHICGGDSTGATCFPNVGPGDITLGQWTKFEAIVCASTSTTAQNGTVRWWINGVEAGRYTTLNYGSGSVNEWWWNQAWDGDAWTSVAKASPATFTKMSTTSWSAASPPLPAIPPPPSTNPPGAPGLVSGFTATVGGVQ
jgi:hypothetical protein